MKVVPVGDFDLEDCLRQVKKQRVVLTSKGKPIALVMDVKGLDLEQIELAQSDDFWKMIESRRKQKTIDRAELEKRIGRKAKAR